MGRLGWHPLLLILENQMQVGKWLEGVDTKYKRLKLSEVKVK